MRKFFECQKRKELQQQIAIWYRVKKRGTMDTVYILKIAGNMGAIREKSKEVI